MATLDPQTLERMRRMARPGRPSLLKRVLGLYVERSPGVVDTLLEAARAGDAINLREAAHRLKGSALGVGAKTLAEVCGQIEGAAKVEDFNDLPDRLERLRVAQAEALEAVRAELGAG